MMTKIIKDVQKYYMLPEMHGERDTRREEMALAILQGLLASGSDKSNKMRWLCKRAITYADILLEELENSGSDELAKR